MNSTSIKNIVEPSYLKDDLLGNLIIDFKNKNLNIDFLLECDIEKSIDEEILSIIGQEENKIEIVDINKTVINDLKENEICDYEDVKFIFEKLNFRGEK